MYLNIVDRDLAMGDYVMFIDREKHEIWPMHYPKVGTIGVVIYELGESIQIQWPRGTTSFNDCWRANCSSVRKIY